MPTKITGTVSGEPLIEVEIGGVYVPWKQGISNWSHVTAVTGSPQTGTFTDANSVTWKWYRWTGNGSVTTTAGIVDCLVVGGGGGSPNSWAHGGAGAVRWGVFTMPSGVTSITVGAGGTGGGSHADGGDSALGSVLKAGGGQGGWQLNSRRDGHGGGGSSGGVNTTDGGQSHRGGGSGGLFYGSATTSGISLSITGSAVEYGRGGYAGAGTGYGWGSTASGGSGSAGVVIIRVPSTFALA